MIVKKYIFLSSLLVVLSSFFLFYQSDFDTQFVIPMRFNRLLTIFLASICVAFSSIIFQTLLNNKILTPSVMGYESIYLLFQVLLQLLGGTTAVITLGITGNFIFSTLILVFYSVVLFQWIFPLLKSDHYLLLLFGLIFSLVTITFAQFFQLLISPSEFAVFQGFTITSFNRATPGLLWISALFLTPLVFFIYKQLAILDVMLLGKDISISLGINYSTKLSQLLIVISFLVSISTSLIGVTAFMGVFIANTSYVISNHFRHIHNLSFAFLICALFFLIAQIFVEHVFNYKTTVNILINLFCGGFFLIYMIYRGRRLKPYSL